MAAIIRKAFQGYDILFDELVDQRTQSWFLVAKPYQVFTILALYLMFVFKWGPNWMKSRPAMNIDKLLIVYNALQITACTYTFIGGIWYAWGWDYKWICEPVDFSNNEKALNQAHIVHIYFLTKVVDLLDTIFFVARKKNNQVTFLHVYHHAGMVILIWGAATYFPGGHGTLVGVINSFVHIVMYGYYLLTVAFPIYKQSLWWKKYITQLQIIQFFWFVLHMSIIVFIPDCAYPRWISAVFLPQNFFMLILFSDFYIKTYIKKPKIKSQVQKNGATIQNGTKKSLNGVQNKEVTRTFRIKNSAITEERKRN